MVFHFRCHPPMVNPTEIPTVLYPLRSINAYPVKRIQLSSSTPNRGIKLSVQPSVSYGRQYGVEYTESPTPNPAKGFTFRP